MSNDLENHEPDLLEQVFTGGEAQKILGISAGRLARYIAELRLDIPRDRALRISREDLERLRTYHKNRADGPRFHESEQARRYTEALKELARTFRSLRKISSDALKLEKRLREMVPAGLAVIHTLPDAGLRLKAPISVNVAPNGRRYRASFPEAGLDAFGATRSEALLELRTTIAREYERLEKGRFFDEEDRERFRILSELITRLPKL
jgi:hypothetical protein